MLSKIYPINYNKQFNYKLIDDECGEKIYGINENRTKMLTDMINIIISYYGESAPINIARLISFPEVSGGRDFDMTFSDIEKEMAEYYPQANFNAYKDSIIEYINTFSVFK